MKYLVIGEQSVSVTYPDGTQKRHEPGEEVLLAPVHAQKFLDAGQFDAIAPPAPPSRKTAKSEHAPVSTEETA